MNTILQALLRHPPAHDSVIHVVGIELMSFLVDVVIMSSVRYLYASLDWMCSGRDRGHNVLHRYAPQMVEHVMATCLREQVYNSMQ